MPNGIIRVVFDTNILLSYFLATGGTVFDAVEFVRYHGVIMASDATIAELAAKMASSRFSRSHGTHESRDGFVEQIRRAATLIEVTTTIQASLDPDDDKFLALAIDGSADCLVTGDKKHLIPLHPFRGIPILSPADFVAQFVVR